ncbi:hypothetical protein L9F63_026357, partial [Diploptera punctata]
MERKEKQDLYSIILPLFYVFKVLGITPFNLEGHIGNRELQISQLSVIYFIVIRIVTLIGHFLHFFGNVIGKSYSGQVFVTATFIIGLFRLLFSIVLFIMSFIKRVLVVELFNKLSDIHFFILDEINLNDNGFKIWQRIVLCLIFIQSIVFIPAIIVADLSIETQNIYEYFIENCNFFSLIPFYLLDILVINVMFLLKQYFSITNSEIVNVMNEFNSSEVLKQLKLKQLKVLHFSICNIADFTNSTYNIQIILIIVDRFLIVSYNVYFAITYVLKYQNGVYSSNIYVIISTSVIILGAAHI